MKVPQQLAEARLRASVLLPYMTQQLMAMHPVHRPGLGTMTVDRHWRLYYDLEWMRDRPLDELAFILLHEALHCYGAHCNRLPEARGNPTADQIAGISFDLCVNSMLRQSKLPPPPDAQLPEQYGLPDGWMPEEYYDALMCHAKDNSGGSGKQQRQQQGGGSSQSNAPASQGQQQGQTQGGDSGNLPPDAPYDGPTPDRSKGEGGSNHGGQQRPWECPAPQGEASDDVPPAMEGWEQEIIRENTSHDIIEHEKREGRGSTPGVLVRMASRILKPQVDPVAELQARVRFAMTATSGYGDFTYRKLARRHPPGGVRLPAHIRPVPNWLLIADTSGSMRERDLGLALGVIHDVLRGLPNPRGGRIITGDTRAAMVQKVFHVEEVQLAGGGGTDMGAIIEIAMQEIRPVPDVILVVTDGETPWPEHPVEARVVAAMTRRSRCYATPEWIEVVELNPQ